MRAIPVLGVLVACGKGGVDEPTYHRDVAPILEGRCVGCHDAGGIGPFPLTTFDEVSRIGEAVASQVEARLMPPWKAVPGHLEYRADPSLTDAQIATLTGWVEAGMPEGDPSDAGPPLPSLSEGLPRVDQVLEMPEPYAPGDVVDDYRCFVLEWAGATEYVTGFEVHPGNNTVVHHVAAFLIRPDNLVGESALQTFRDWDAAEAGPGYTCFGGPSATGESLAVPIQQVAQWVPGGGAVLFPDGVGIEIPVGSQVILQMHYNTSSFDGLPDLTTVDLQTESSVTRLGAFAPWLDAAWTFGTMVLPPNTQITHTIAGDPLGFFALLLGDTIDLSNGFDIHAAMLHMHTLGQSGIVRLDRADSSSQVLLEVEDWDFDWQINYQFAAPVSFTPGDALHLACTFDNPGDEAIGWGEGSGEEMCVGNLFVSAPN